METILQRLGIRVTRNTQANWMIKCSELLQPIYNVLNDQLLSSGYIHMDETTVQVLKEKGRRPQSKSYMWVAHGGPPGKKVLLYRYDPSRAHHVPQEILEGYKGYLQTDGHKAYYCLEGGGITLVGCFAHARRYFKEAVDTLGKDHEVSSLAKKGLEGIRRLYRIEKQASLLSPSEKFILRNQQARPILEEIKIWLDHSLMQVPPKTHTGKALHYLNSHWKYLMRYLDDGNLAIDNNQVENAIRPFVIGRKNWLFSETPAGAHSSAVFYSLIESAKLHELEPHAYLREVFEKIPAADTVEKVEALLPWNVNTQKIKRQPR
jgi:hypothetical protein